MTKTMRPQADEAFRKKVLACTHVLNDMLFELQGRYGTEAVVAAVMDVAGCSMCVADKTSHGRVESLRALLDRLEGRRVPSGTRN